MGALEEGRMAARLAIGVDPRERLRRLSVVFAVELRLKIVAELYMREMSAKQFYEEFGGGTSTRVNQNFKTLEKEGWLRYVRSEGPGGDRRGGVEHFYRATEPAYFDVETWALVPYSVRVASTWNIFKQIAPRLRGVLEASSVETGRKRDLSCTQFLLDQKGWKRAIAAVDAQFIALFEEQEDSRLRALQSGEELIPADVFLIAFESPTGAEESVGGSLVESQREPLAPFPERLSPILGDDVRMQIVSELNRREMSVTQFHREIGGASKGGISRRFKGLEGGGWVKKVKMKSGGPRRGATEQFYRATKPAIHGYDPCADPPDLLEGTGSWQTFERFCARVREAIAAGIFDVRVDRYVTWALVRFDAQGWANIIEGIDALFEFIHQEQEQAERRMAKSGEDPIAMTVGLAAFEALKDSVKAP